MKKAKPQFTIYPLISDKIKNNYLIGSLFTGGSKYLFHINDPLISLKDHALEYKISRSKETYQCYSFEHSFFSIKDIGQPIRFFNTETIVDCLSEFMNLVKEDDEHDFKIDSEFFTHIHRYKNHIPDAIKNKKSVTFSKLFIAQNIFSIIGENDGNIFFHKAAIDTFSQFLNSKEHKKYVKEILLHGDCLKLLNDPDFIPIVNQYLDKNEAKDFLLEFFEKNQDKINSYGKIIPKCQKIIEQFFDHTKELEFLFFIKNLNHELDIEWIPQDEYHYCYEKINLKNIQQQFANPNIQMYDIKIGMHRYFSLLDKKMSTFNEIKDIDEEGQYVNLLIQSDINSPYRKSDLLRDLKNLSIIISKHFDILENNQMMQNLFDNLKIQEELDLSNTNKNRIKPKL